MFNKVVDWGHWVFKSALTFGTILKQTNLVHESIVGVGSVLNYTEISIIHEGAMRWEGNHPAPWCRHWSSTSAKTAVERCMNGLYKFHPAKSPPPLFRSIIPRCTNMQHVIYQGLRMASIKCVIAAMSSFRKLKFVFSVVLVLRSFSFVVILCYCAWLIVLFRMYPGCSAAVESSSCCGEQCDRLLLVWL